MKPMTRREFNVMTFMGAAGIAATATLGAQQNGKIPDIGASQTGLTEFPKGYGPKELGKMVAERFVVAPHLRPTRILYPEVITWNGVLDFAHLTDDKALVEKMRGRFEPLFGNESALLPPVGEHVDFSMFGSLPLELYMLTAEKRYLEMGLRYADAQWSKPDAQGLTRETRFWIDDMYMITIVQMQAYRATKDAKYMDRAAKEMAAYLDKLQQPNGLFYHALEVPYFWGRGNGWVAAGLTEVLSDMPANHPQKERLLRGYRLMMASLLKYQEKDGTWRQLVDREESWPETSCTAMFAFALITGVKKGWLAKNPYEAVARKAWMGLAGYLDQNGDVTSVCEGTNKLNNLPYYLLRKRRTGDFHGQASFMWAVTALLRSGSASQRS